MKEYRVIFILYLVLHFLIVPASAAEKPLHPLDDFSFSDIKGNAETILKKFSGRSIRWEGKLKTLVSNEAYFDYLVELSTGDRIHVLSDKGLPFKPGDNLDIRGFIMIKDGRFSHVVVEKASIAYKPIRIIRYGQFDDYSLSMSDKAVYNRIIKWINYYNGGVSPSSAKFIAGNIIKYSKKYRVDPFLVTALISAESAFNMQAVSVVGAIGLGQLMPGTASMMGVNPYNPEQNIAGSVRYLRAQLDRWKNARSPVSLALASYNAGPGAVEKYRGIPPYRETIDYVIVVTAFYNQIRFKPAKTGG